MSLVFTDPKGELYRKLTKYLETKGYDVKVFNLVNPTYSNAANFIKFVEDETDAEIFSKIVIEGTQLARKSGGDEFWNRGEQNLLKALLLYVINYVEKEEDKSIGFIYDVLASGNIKQIDKLFFDISRKEFEENLSEAKEDILSYVKALEDALRALEQKIDIVYCKFVQNETGAYKWIFEQPFIKSIVLKFLEYWSDIVVSRENGGDLIVSSIFMTISKYGYYY